MPVARKDVRGVGSFTAPLLGAVLLVACYVVVTDWHTLPHVINDALAGMNFIR
jgi:hypothetical protein